MKMRKEALVYFLVFCFLSPLEVYAQNMDSNSPGQSFFSKRANKRGKMIEEVYGQLNLSDDQKKQLEANKGKWRENRKANFEKMKTLKEALNDELMKPELDRNKINDIQAQFKALQSQMTDDRLDSILEVREILAPEQFTKFNSLMKERKKNSPWGNKGP